MNEEESDDLVLLDEPMLDADDLVEVALEPVDDDGYEPSEEVIFLDMHRLDEEDLLEVA